MSVKRLRPGARGIDWPAIHRRLETLRGVVQQGWAPDPQEAQRILKARAEALARPLAQADSQDRQYEVVEFALAYENYAIESSFVREVYPLTDLTPVPCTPSFVLGIVNVRGEIVSVIDIKKFFDLPEKGLTDLNKAIILQSDSMTFGILADLIVGVRTVAARDIQPPPATLTGIREQYLMGVTRDPMVILDAVKLLSDPKIVVHQTYFEEVRT
ncbi:MAG TPA: chemotaxis protein CheW [Burkholderiaceae bacterium]|jgi:purine-binding chemotaxis protein CheW